MKKIILTLLLFSTVLFLTGCQDKAEYTNISNEDLATMLETPDDYQFIDVRTLSEYNDIHVPGFDILIDVHILEYDLSLLDRLDKDKPVVIMCNSGNRSVDAAQILWDNGFTDLYNLTDGIQGWIRDEYETE